jgi:hypothetical protein
MPIDPQEFARMLGAELVGELPDVGGGPFGMARLARIMHQRLTPGQGERPGRPTNPNWVTRCKVPMSEATLEKLTRMAEEMSTDQRQVSPMQVAAQLLEEALDRVQGKTEAPAETDEQDPDDLASSEGATAPPGPRTRVVGTETKVGPGLKTKFRDVEGATADPADAGEEVGPAVTTKLKEKAVHVEAPKTGEPRGGRRKAGRERKKA